MAYSTVPRIIQDEGFGYQSVNQVRDNLVAIHAAWIAEHGGDTPPGFFGGTATQTGPTGAPLTFGTLGNHNHISVPRGVINVVSETVTYGSNAGQTVQFVGSQLNSGLIIGTPARLALGVYFMRFSFLDPNSWVEAQAHATTTARRHVMARVFNTLSGAAVSGILVHCRELSGGDWVFADYNFSLFIFSA